MKSESEFGILPRMERSVTHPIRTGAYEQVAAAIAEQRCVILDGGIATELPHQHGQDHERLWGIEGLASAPDQVRDVLHRRYVDAGVDVITTNTWAPG
jgi:S-methylmethionine-dependent homocysteine/selenocysteine methylase